MPPTRSTKRIASGPTAQSTLSFNKNKVTKQAPKSKSKSLFTASTKGSDSDVVAPIKEDVRSEAADVAIKKQVEKEKERPRTQQEVLAEKVGDAQVKRYWKERESERISCRVHQNDLSLEEKVLRLFDMSSQYGPAIGISRTKRWFRASKLGLNPPIEVLAVLLKEEKRGNVKIERAHVDELMSNKTTIGES